MNCDRGPDFTHFGECRKIRRILTPLGGSSPQVMTVFRASTSTLRHSDITSRNISSKSPTTTLWRAGAIVALTVAVNAAGVASQSGFHSSVLIHITDDTYFLWPAYLALELSDSTEQVLMSSADSKPDSTGTAPHRSAYDSELKQLCNELAEPQQNGSNRPRKRRACGSCFPLPKASRRETVLNTKNGDSVGRDKPLTEEELYTKKQAGVHRPGGNLT